MTDLDALERKYRRAILSATPPSRDTVLDWTRAIDAALPALIAELRAARQDAARYRWLHDGFLSLHDDYSHITQELTIAGIPLHRQRLKDGRLGSIDAAVDAAIAKGGPT